MLDDELVEELDEELDAVSVFFVALSEDFDGELSEDFDGELSDELEGELDELEPDRLSFL